jgi:large subunit ribosomal protein L25
MAQQQNEIKASVRERTGTGGARAVRREAQVPGIVYGDGKAPQSVSLHSNELVNLISRGKFLSTLIELNIDGTKTRVIPREVQMDPVNDKLVHIDFQRVGQGAHIRVNVPVRFINEALSPGLKRGGVLNIVRHEVEVTAPADKIPEYFEFNLEGLEIGRSVHISAVKMPEGVRPTIQNRDFTVATIAGHKIEEEPTPGTATETVEGAAPVEGAEGAAAPAAEGGDKAAAAPGAKVPAAGAGAKPAAGAKAAAPAAKAGADKGKK